MKSGNESCLNKNISNVISLTEQKFNTHLDKGKFLTIYSKETNKNGALEVTLDNRCDCHLCSRKFQ